MVVGEVHSKLISSEVFPALQSCCAQGLHAVIASPYSSSAMTGNFRRIRDDSVAFNIRGQATTLFERMTPAVVSFVLENTLHVFVATVLSHQPGADSGTLTLTIPPFILQPDLRRSFRIPLPQGSRLHVQLESQGYTVLEPNVLDLSDGGMLIEFADDPGLDLNAGHPVRLQMDELIAHFIAEVRHSRDGKYGMMFLDTHNAAESLREKEALQKIVAEIKEYWLSRDH